MTRYVRLAVVRGDGIGTEVVEEGLKVLDAALAGSGVAVGPHRRGCEFGRALANGLRASLPLAAPGRMVGCLQPRGSLSDETRQLPGDLDLHGDDTCP